MTDKVDEIAIREPHGVIFPAGALCATARDRRRVRDTKLDRDVAIKILLTPARYKGDPVSIWSLRLRI